MCIVLLLLFCLAQPGLGAELTIYPHAPGTVLDPRVVASVRSRSNGPSLSDLRLAVEDAPATPQTRDPGHGRPPFTSSRLRLATGKGITSVRVTLQCIGVGCTFGKEAVLRGVNFKGRIEMIYGCHGSTPSLSNFGRRQVVMVAPAASGSIA